LNIFWSAPVRWRFGIDGLKAVEDHRSPGRFAFNRAMEIAPAFGVRQSAGALGMTYEKRQRTAAVQDASENKKPLPFWRKGL
jgi:hypothetical protein